MGFVQKSYENNLLPQEDRLISNCWRAQLVARQLDRFIITQTGNLSRKISLFRSPTLAPQRRRMANAFRLDFLGQIDW